jgi:hypothetical protein
MAFTHYPKTVKNIVFAWVQPPPLDVEPKKGHPNFIGRPFSEINLFKKPIAPNEAVVAHHDAQPFTRFYGSIFSDQPLLVTFAFSNDECGPDGNSVSDEALAHLNYDAEALKHIYNPEKQESTGRFFITIYGRWLRVTINNSGTELTNRLRLYCRGSVF